MIRGYPTAVSNRVVGDVAGRTCVLIDDMIDTGGTIAGAVALLHNDGAGDVIIAATHGVLSDPAAQRLASCGAREVIVTNTLPIGEDKRFPSSPFCPSRRCWPAQSGRSSKTAQ